MAAKDPQSFPPVILSLWTKIGRLVGVHGGGFRKPAESLGETAFRPAATHVSAGFGPLRAVHAARVGVSSSRASASTNWPRIRS